MSFPRFYLKKALSPSMDLILTESVSHHLHVLRKVPGETITLFNGEGGEYEAVIEAVQKKSVSVKIKHFHPREAESPLSLTLAQGIAKGEKMDFIIQKAVELGVSIIQPVLTEYSNVRLDEARSHKRFLHWQKVIISASEQCGRNTLSQLQPIIPFLTFVKSQKSARCFVLSPQAELNLKDHPKSLLPTVFLIGPEGGLSEAEMRISKEEGFIPLRLGPRILRTETAALAALSVLQYHDGDLGNS